MRKWLSSLIYTLLALAIIAFSLPFILGLVAKNRCQEMVEFINSNTLFDAKIVKYKRGWLKSHATTQISPKELVAEKQKLYQFNINADITHGPLVIDWARFHFAQAMIKAHVKLNEEQNLFLKRNPESKPIATANIKLKLSGNARITIDSPPLSYEEENMKIDWRGLEAVVHSTSLYNKSNIEISGLDIATKERNIHIGKITDFDQDNKSSDDSWLSEKNINIETITIKSIYDRILSFKEVNIKTITKEKDNIVKFDTSMTADNININDGIYTQNKIDLTIDNLDKEIIYQLSQEQILTNKNITSPSAISSDIAMTLLSKGCDINLKLHSNTPWGKSSADIEITYPQKTDINIFSLFTNIAIKTSINIKKALALHLLEKFYQNFPNTKEKKDPIKQAEDLLDEWQKSEKIVTENNEGLIINVEFKNSQLFINNKPLVISLKP